MKKEATLQFKFRVKYFPENVTDEIIQDSTLRLLYLQVETPSLLCILSQVRSAILSEAVHCPAEKAVLLASFGVQAKYGNQDTEVSVRREGGRGSGAAWQTRPPPRCTRRDTWPRTTSCRQVSLTDTSSSGEYQRCLC